MRICYVSHSDSHFTRPYVDYFSQRGNEVHLVSILGAGLPGAINHLPLGRNFSPTLRSLGYLRALPVVRKILRSLRPCIVHAHYVSSNGVLAAFSGCHPLVLSARGSDLHGLWNPVRRAVLRYALTRADLVNQVSRAFERDLISLGASAARILTLSQGVESARFLTHRSSAPQDGVRLLCTRSLSPHYNPRGIVQALAILRSRRVLFRFLFAAGGPQESSLKREVARRGLVDHVTFRGGYTQDELPALLAQADVYVSASYSDGTSVSLLEAMASGAFPVVSDVAGNREWISGNGDGRLFVPNDPGHLADCLQEAIEGTDLRRFAVRTNRRTIDARGERTRNLAELAGAYTELWDRAAR